MTTYTITCTSRMSKGMVLNGNVLSGDTYGVREHIKAHWGGKWDASIKAWIVDAEIVIKTIHEQSLGFCRVLSISTASPAHTATQTRNSNMGLCPKCHTRCYGDCSA